MKHDDIRDLADLRAALREFAAERDWRQFHTPKNLAMAMIVEAAELVEHFQWATPEQSLSPAPEKLAEIRDEVADVLIYLTELADVLDELSTVALFGGGRRLVVVEAADPFVAAVGSHPHAEDRGVPAAEGLEAFLGRAQGLDGGGNSGRGDGSYLEYLRARRHREHGQGRQGRGGQRPVLDQDRQGAHWSRSNATPRAGMVMGRTDGEPVLCVRPILARGAGLLTNVQSCTCLLRLHPAWLIRGTSPWLASTKA